MQVKIKIVDSRAKLPTYGSDGAAAFDLYAVRDDTVNVHAQYRPIIDTGLQFEIPEGHAMLVFSRSGQGFNSDVRLSNSVGIIDSDYRGTVKVKLANDSNPHKPYPVKHGDRIAQALILPVERIQFIEVDELSHTQRGEGGFGSTGS